MPSSGAGGRAAVTTAGGRPIPRPGRAWPWRCCRRAAAAWPDRAAVTRPSRDLRTACRRWCRAGSATSCATSWRPSPAARRSCCRAATAPRRSPRVTADNVRNKLRTLLQMAVVLTYAARGAGGQGGPARRAVRQAALVRHRDATRPAGLPRRRGQRLRAHRRVARARPAAAGRAYTLRASTLNLVRAFATGGFADLRQVHDWNTDFVASSPAGERYEEMAARDRPGAALHAGLRRRPTGELHRVDFYTSHEALLLEYERALTRTRTPTGRRTTCPAHFVWIGERTRAPRRRPRRAAVAGSATRSASSSARRSTPTTRSRWPSGSTPTTSRAG